MSGTVHPVSYKSAGSGSYSSGRFVRLIHDRELATERLAISSSGIAQVRTPCSNIGIVHPEGCTMYISWSRMVCIRSPRPSIGMYIRRVVPQLVQDETHQVASSGNALPSGCASGCSAIYGWFCQEVWVRVLIGMMLIID